MWIKGTVGYRQRVRVRVTVPGRNTDGQTDRQTDRETHTHTATYRSVVTTAQKEIYRE